MSPVRVVVADDSEIFREGVRLLLEADGDIEVVAEAGDRAEALAAVVRTRPALLLLDVEMPGSGLTVIEEAMSTSPLPILVLSALPTGQGSLLPFEAIRRGALECMSKESLTAPEGAGLLRSTVRFLATVPVVTRPRPRPAAAFPERRPTWQGAVPLVAIGASAGGPPALARVVSQLPADFPACVAVVQHLSRGFAPSFRDFLAAETALEVRLADAPVVPRAGLLVLPPDDHHLEYTGARFEARQGPPLHGHRPAVDRLFLSLAAAAAPRTIGLVMTGMGRDGADGLLALRRAGAETLTQDEQSAAVYGMPRAAMECGAAVRAIPLEQLAAELIAAVGGRRA